MNQQVAEAFKKLYYAKRTGVLTCKGNGAQRAVFFQSGFVVRASSSDDEDRLGEVMIRHGRITRQQFKDASNFIKSGWRLGEILVELNIIEEAEIDVFVKLQLLDIACTQLIAPPKRLAFSTLSSVEACLEAPLSVADILMEAARRSSHLDDEIARIKEDNRPLGYPGDPLKLFQSVHLKPEEGFVLSRIDGAQTPKEILALSPLAEEQTARTLLGLLAAEVIQFEGEAMAAPEEEPAAEQVPSDTEPSPHQESERAAVEKLFEDIADQDHWQVLGVGRGASAEEIKGAFLAGAKRFHPDRFGKITEPEFQEKLSFVFRRINEAFKTLSSDELRSDYESLHAREEQYQRAQDQAHSAELRGDPDDAKACYHRAKRAYDENDFWSAIELARQAVQLAPDVAAYYHLLGLALSKNPKWRQDAEKNLKIAANMDPFKASYQLDLAKLYEEAGLHLRAQKTMEKAKAINPNLDDAD